jgi:hypothetical protein
MPFRVLSPDGFTWTPPESEHADLLPDAAAGDYR